MAKQAQIRPTAFLRVRNFERFQHYKDRNPPWIKMYRGLLDDYSFARLPDASKAHAVCIMLLASQLDNKVPADPDWIAQRIGANSKIDLQTLLNSSFIELCDAASNPLALCEQNAPLEEKRRGEKRREEQASVRLGEILWRVEECWTAHLKQRDLFYRSENGSKPPIAPTKTQEIEAAITEAIETHDGHLLGPDQRDEWKRLSKARAAGIGLFFDDWMTGKREGNRIGHDQGAKTYLEAWRPWKRQKGKADPVERFADLYFEDMAR